MCSISWANFGLLLYSSSCAERTRLRPSIDQWSWVLTS